MKNKISPLGWLVAALLLTAAAVVPIQSNFFTSTNYQGTTASTARTYLGLGNMAIASTNSFIPYAARNPGQFDTSGFALNILDGANISNLNIYAGSLFGNMDAHGYEIQQLGLASGDQLNFTSGTIGALKSGTVTLNSGSTGVTNAQTRQDIQTNLTDTIWTKNISLVFTGDSLTSTDHVNWPIYLTNAVGGPWSNAPIGFATNTAIGSDLAGNIWTNYDTRIGQYILATASATTNVYLLVWAGINDIGITGGHLGATNAIASLSNIWAKARFQGAKVVAFTITDSSAFTTQDRYERQNLNSMIRGSGHNGTNGWDYLVDVDQNFASGPGLPTYLQRTLDGVHFTTNVQAQIAKLVDTTLRNGTRGSQPFPQSQIDAAHGFNSPLLSWPNTYLRQQIITPAWNADLYQNTAGNAMIYQDISNYVSIAFDAPNINTVFWNNFPSGKFSTYFGPGTGQNVDGSPYMYFLYSAKTWRMDNAVGIGADPGASAAFQVDSTTKGLLPPRMTKAQRDAISSPATGLVVYQTDNTPGLYYYSGSAWTQVGASVSAPIIVASVAQLNLTAGIAETTLYTPNGHTMYEVSAVYSLGGSVAIQTNTLTLSWRDNVSASNTVNLIDHVVRSTVGSINVAPYTFIAANNVTISYTMTSDGLTGSSANTLYITLKELQ